MKLNLRDLFWLMIVIGMACMLYIKHGKTERTRIERDKLIHLLDSATYISISEGRATIGGNREDFMAKRSNILHGNSP